MSRCKLDLRAIERDSSCHLRKHTLNSHFIAQRSIFVKASKFVGRVPCSKERTLSVRFEKNDVLGDVDCSRIVSAAY